MSRFHIAKTAMAPLATVALALVGASSASAHGWVINGTELTTTAALAHTAAVDTPYNLRAPSLGLRITCTGKEASITKGELLGSAKIAQGESFSMEGCSEISPAACKLSSTTISSNAFLWLLSLVASILPLRILLHAPSGKVLSMLTFEGAECAVEGSLPITGIAVRALQESTNEQVLQPLEGLGTTENNSLEIAKSKLYIEGGRTLLKLASGLKWTFLP